jgi:hypothetical protein
MALRFALAGSKNVSDADLDWIANKGFSELQICVTHGDTANDLPAKIHARNMLATINPYNDTSFNDPGRSGASELGYIQALNKAGWDMVAGEGVSGDVVATICKNGMKYCNYAGSGGPIIAGDYGGCGQIDAYHPNAPWQHPRDGNHRDYIEVYCGDSGNVAQCGNSTIQRMLDAITYGNNGFNGLLVGMWGNPMAWGADYLVKIIDAANGRQAKACNTVLFWIGYTENPAQRFQTSGASGIMDQLISRYQLDNTKKNVGTTAASVSAKTNKVVTLGFKTGKRNETSRAVAVNTPTVMAGHSGFKDAADNMTATPNTQQLSVRRVLYDAAGEVAQDIELNKIWPDKNGYFEFTVRWGKRQTAKYKVGIL